MIQERLHVSVEADSFADAADKIETALEADARSRGWKRYRGVTISRDYFHGRWNGNQRAEWDYQ